MDDPREPLYLAVAADLAGLISAGQLRPRQRVPSVRRLAEQRGVSITTAVASLRHLEERGLIEARPKSGYFVSRRRPQLAEPRAVALPRTARLVGAQAMLKRLVDASLNPAVVRLGQAIPDPSLFPHRALQRSLLRASRRVPDVLTSYPLRMNGSSLLREEIARHYAMVGMKLAADDLIITNGCTEALTLALRAVAKPGDTIAVESPTYFAFLQMAESQGVKVLEIPVHPHEGLSIESLRDLLGSRAGRDVRACALVSSFSNPTGASLSRERRRELVRLCDTVDIALIEDDVYGDMQHEGARPVPCKSFDRDGRVLLCSSFSKSLAPGARVGFLTSGRYRDTLRAAKQVQSGANNVLQQEMIAEFLKSGRYERHLRQLRRVLRQNLEQLSQCVQDAFPEGTRLSRPSGGMVLWAELPEDVDTLQLYDEASRIGVDFVPGVMFSASGRYRNCLRLNGGYPVNAATNAAIRRLGNLLRTKS
jgi:DNA-binding transcriptional MocR family regulator